MRSSISKLICQALSAVFLSIEVNAQQSQAAAFMNSSYFDTTSSPCLDFFQYANGGWLKTVVIPPDRNMWGPRIEVEQRNQAVIYDILDSLAYSPRRNARDVTEQKLGRFYCQCMDTTVAASTQLKAIQPEFDRIQSIKSLKMLSGEIGHLQSLGVDAFFWFVVIDDYYAPTTTIAEIRNFWVLSIQAKQYYVDQDSVSVAIRKSYLEMAKHLFIVLGDKPDKASVSAEGVLRLETALAKAQPNDSGPVNNKISIRRLQKLTPNFDWKEFVSQLGRPDLTSINIRPPQLLHKIDSLTRTISLDDWKAYLKFSLILKLGPSLDFAFDDAIGDFFRKVYGIRQKAPRSKMCTNIINGMLGDALGKAYVEKAFSPQAKQKAIALAESERSVLRERLLAAQWLSAESKAKAVTKLDSMTMQIGYPESWTDYSGLEVNEDAPLSLNLLSIKKFNRSIRLSKIQKANAKEWFDSPTIADATYYATANTLSITAAYFQPPFFDPNGDDIANYAAVGFTIGHELTHGFDSYGRQYNEKGVLTDWWTSNDVKEFNRRAEFVVKQYNQFTIVDTLKENGQTTLSENIADIGGLKLAYLAFKKATSHQRLDTINGFTPDQRFFIAFAQSTFRVAMSPERQRVTALTDQHSAERWRINGPLMSMPEFAAAFGCKSGDTMTLLSLSEQIW